MDKDELRKIILQERKNIEDKENKDAYICQKIISSIHFMNSKTIAFYMAKDGEADIITATIEAWKSGKTVVLPKIINNELNFVLYQQGDTLLRGKFNILEPKENIIVPPGDIDLFIIPGLAFDEKYHRLGYGKGYYDRYLKNVNAYKIGVCYKKFLFKEIPYNQNDVLMDEILTE